MDFVRPQYFLRGENRSIASVFEKPEDKDSVHQFTGFQPQIPGCGVGSSKME